RPAGPRLLVLQYGAGGAAARRAVGGRDAGKHRRTPAVPGAWWASLGGWGAAGGSGPTQPDPGPHRGVRGRLKRLSNEAASDPTWARIKTRLEFLMCDKSMVSDDLIETRRAIYAQPGFSDTMRRIMCLQEMEIRRPNMITEAQYRSIEAPTLVVWTSHDPTATPAEGKQISEMIPGAQYVVMNECGHWPQFEDAELFNRLHIDFLLGK
ncbi:alpha/beta fold hydrolase, partial [Methylobacterium platani]|uniref:alpha/beta fold hydrolase n=1 Tax=Methylobacterium platani TaxID=427683 RepID=UPI001FD7D907